MDHNVDVDAFLEHHGVKGMKWGIRRDEAVLNRMMGVRTFSNAGTHAERKAENEQAKADFKAYKATTSKEEQKADRAAAMQSKGQYLVEEALKDPDTIISTQSPAGYQMMLTGKEFTEHLSNGGAINLPMTNLTGMRINRPKGAS